ncbi:hypothetical protein RDWZM_005723 [Blomia tropicalis]|uniref:[histone H3]-lysine(27) N-trimethyltransferase n=1 Tax=Blomia tropicalis TaxID=40697 RepID=A0A9Q0RNP7_BLOTA|nr:hypothetical protein RDWZM_005723 [Blomia tropicalis]
MLHHVPYLGEEVDKHGFVEDLARSYDGLVYGHDLACNEKLYQLVKRLTTTSDSTINNRQLKMNQNGSNNSKPIDMEVVFQLLADMFSAEGFKAEDLAKRYRLYVDQLNLPPDAPQTIMKNLDTEILEQNYSYTPFYRAMDDEKLSIYGPCENMCFLLIHGVHIEKYNTRKPPTPASSLPFEEALIEKPPTVIVQTIEQADIQHNHWTTTEQTLFNVLMPTMKGNFCKIAGTIGTKTCAEVYVFAQQVDVQLAITSASVLSSDANMINMKKKKETKKNSRKVWLQLIHEKGGNGNESERNKSHYQPCDHIGQQCDTNCICVKNETFCEKFCNCTDCPRKFPGCNCKATCNTKACPCFVANRECDPDLCQSCGSLF